MMKRLRARRHPANTPGEVSATRSTLRAWPQMVLFAVALLCLFLLGQHFHWDTRVLAAVTLLFGLLSGLLVWLIGVIGLVPLIGPIIVKVLSFGFIWLLNAVGYLMSYIAIRRGYSRDVLTYRGLTMALLIGIVIGYIIAQFI
ncbi:MULTISPECIES: hypothetical protein [unclassified Methylophilus]|uniref:hypothetical protein n=1 Tax=unclassified Methylophilus TaxID=2630143 RepID=UPI00188E4FE1|nr:MULTISPECIES: hypothetical protein [unclassified Methylophilus]MBF5038827.1 hypothetical protein [Methylophilus sp. 13]MDF0377000.1 hypothetical protein [Methylophilus sp. YYY-1]